jgi:hypothetical protein
MARNKANVIKKIQYRSTAYGQYPGLIELDIATREDGRKKGKRFNYGKEGHFAKDCRQPKKATLYYRNLRRRYYTIVT